ncbi:hypothetical protein BSL78_01302 [Apostichopus japonicus]|uniref:Uncharacterized protein n=1 Tax=Stichopus japonicus TaxID=307972 RepID=A0A2G8LNB6_STIJA|nr:hypothetical protein BSL78_01302 [Apostichopus japonicus]
MEQTYLEDINNDSKILGSISCQSVTSTRSSTCYNSTVTTVSRRLKVCCHDKALVRPDKGSSRKTQPWPKTSDHRGSAPLHNRQTDTVAMACRLRGRYTVLGVLHIEMTGFKMIGDWLEDSGWVEAIVQSGVTSIGTTDSFWGIPFTRTRHAHQVTASYLYILLRKSYDNYKGTLDTEVQPEGFDDWRVQKKQGIPQFNFWYTMFQLELLVLTYVRAQRVGDFALYTDSLTKIAPWFFSLDHTTYARWMSVHVRDMTSLSRTHPDIAAEFNKGNFTVCTVSQDGHFQP